MMVMSCDSSTSPNQDLKKSNNTLVTVQSGDAVNATLDELPIYTADGFYFLPPLVKDSEPSGTFDPGLSPVVEICETTACDELHASFDMDGDGSERVRVDEEDEHYIVNWNTNSSGAVAGEIYRIRVSVAGSVLAHADVHVVRNGRDANQYRSAGEIAVVANQTLPIKFHIEQGTVSVVGSEGGTIVFNDGTMTLEVPEGALNEEIGIMVTLMSENLDDPDMVADLIFEFNPSGTQFAAPVKVTIKYDPNMLPVQMNENFIRIKKFTDGMWKSIQGSIVDITNSTVSAMLTSFSLYGVGEIDDFSSKTIVIPDAWSIDLESDELSNTSDLRMDLFWEQQTPSERYLKPINAAVIANLGEADYNALNYQTLINLVYNNDTIDGSDDSNEMPIGTVIAVRTTEYNYAKLKVMDLDKETGGLTILYYLYNPCEGIDCPNGYSCFSGTCFPDCTGGQVSDPDHICYDGSEPDACTGVNCPAGYVCYGGGCFLTCVEEEFIDDPTHVCYDERYADPCYGVSCDEGYVCYEGGCYQGCTEEEIADPENVRCTGDACLGLYCPEGTACYEGTCFVTCTEDEIADPDNAQCYEEPGACADVNCPAGYVCYGGGCFLTCVEEEFIDDPTHVCYDDRYADPCYGVNCPDGMVCHGGTCFEGCSEEDTFDPFNEHCYDPCAGVNCDDGYACYQGTCILDCDDPFNELCYDESHPCYDVDCPDGYVCYGGACFLSCGGDRFLDDPSHVCHDPCTEEEIADPENEECYIDPCADVNCPDGYSCYEGTCILIEVTPASGTITIGDTQQFSAAIYDQNSNIIEDETVAWSSNHSGIATVDETGLATGISEGETAIIASFGEASGSATLSVEAQLPLVDRIEVTPATATINTGDSQQFVATVYDQTDEVMEGETVTWTSDNSGIASVDMTGLATGNSEGETVIMAASGTVTGSAQLNVLATAESGFFLANNGITIRCPDAEPGEIGVVDGVEYEAVDRALLLQRRDEGADLTLLCTTPVTDMTRVFDAHSTFNQDIGGWDTGNVTSMISLFNGASSFNQDIGEWDTGNVMYMSSMFSWAESFNQDIGRWNTSNVLTMNSVFSWAESFNQDIGGWDTGSVSNMNSMFSDAISFDQDIGGWDVSSVTTMTFMFFRATTFNQDLSGWCVSEIDSEPSGFDDGTDSWIMENSRPIWGTCPSE